MDFFWKITEKNLKALRDYESFYRVYLITYVTC